MGSSSRFGRINRRLFSIFLVFPVFSFVATILIGFIPGTPGPNRFGEEPPA